MNNRNVWGLYLFLQIISFLFLSYEHFQPIDVLFLLVSVILLVPTLLSQNWLGHGLTLALFYLLSFKWPEFSYFLPGAWCMVNRSHLLGIPWLVLCSGSVFLIADSGIAKIFVITMLIFVYFFNAICLDKEKLMQNHLVLQDDSWEQEQLLRQKNEELQATQQAMIQLEIAEERNRIARDIHDNVGHLLSSAIIQMGALEVLAQEDDLKKPLHSLKETIHTGMDKVRESVHDLHESSLGFQENLQRLVEAFQFCPITIQGNLSKQLTNQQSRVLLLVTKEALANVMKHSNATHIIIEETDLPAFYRFRIKDNGQKVTNKMSKGLGLVSMQQRVKEIGGQLHINASNAGFMITIILPKEGTT
ncbi:hypothetical protein DOK78_002860 [Enterococcus sp. DIV2402]|uniref:histidine kinase n=1 Tax=Candidatus Enterococcus lowellii TaxID=2230877 RepID=A0ABZ2SR17_9ENTE|nr:sensor histidine kinase [Enterococcus sp. DIV2402]MBO0464893.1 sensor histidine kinase [Enterococcus sp. DIV2402]